MSNCGQGNQAEVVVTLDRRESSWAVEGLRGHQREAGIFVSSLVSGLSLIKSFFDSIG